MTNVKTDLLPCIEINPSAAVRASVIWLHGLGADGSDFVPIVQELGFSDDFGLRFVFPHAPLRPVTINQGYNMRAWYDIGSMDINRQIDQNGIGASAKLVSALIEQEIQHGTPCDKIILAGFSQGAVIALMTALQYPKRLGGILALSGYLPANEPFLEPNRNIPIFLAHGTEDAVVPYSLGQNALSLLVSQGYNVDWHHYKMGHSVCLDEIRDIKKWLEKIL